jgi:predicted nucleotidyltransferase
MYYGLNEEHPWIPGLKIIFENSSIGIIPLLREALVSIQGIEVAYVFGSFAIGEQNVRSDIDLVVIGRHDREALDDRMDIFEKRTDRILDPFEYTPEEWIKYLRDYPSFAETMMPKRKLFLIGDDERLERLTKA